MSTGINIAPSSDITVGTTAVTSGTDTRVFFQAGGVVQQDANFTFDNTLKRLTLKAVGTASTDIPFAVQNSAGTGLLFQATGDGKHSFNMSPNTNFALSIDQTNQNGGISVYSSGQTIFNVAKIAGPVGYMGVLNNGNYSFFTGNSSYFNHSLVVGGNSLTPGARLDVRAQGALSTDIAFRVRNSADTQNLMSIQGDGKMNLIFNGDTDSTIINGTRSGAVATAIGVGTNAGLRSVALGYSVDASGIDGVAVGYNINATAGGASGIAFGATISGNNNGISIGRSITNNVGIAIGRNISFSGNNNATHFFGFGLTDTSNLFEGKVTHTFGFGSYGTTGNKPGLTYRSNNLNQLLLGYYSTDSQYSSINGTNWLGVKTGTAPDGAVDAFQMYSADITAGNAAPHFRTENGAIVKVYQETTAVGASTLVSNAGTNITDTDTFDGYTIQQIVKALRNQGLLA